ncbi:ANTAR domain-containing protein [Kribbella turkmenica]|uniref:ANTAR domain-containing protein n=1 Tax=Kribbella turkmenica TaxID=2530375 RepID=A0A4R4X8W2_9ACTN|nr:GAF and ANTAR domain-containing protein [Kribbella turkmenica]TDD26914.1 ANTAR domain-containing protein [Kribbella turkmenica]
MADEHLVETMRQLSKALTPRALDETLRNITAAAVELLPPVHYASITVLHDDGRLEAVAPTDDLLLPLDAAQYELQEGPCYQAAASTVHIISPVLASDQRFPKYAAIAGAAGVKAQAGLRLFDAPKANGALNLYSREDGAFEDFDSLAALFAHQSATAIEYAREIDNLEEALRTRTTIGQAVGIVMERYKLTEQRAFAFLARLSQTSNVKLRRISEEVVEQVERQSNQL